MTREAGAGPALGDELLRRIVILVHPDRHPLDRFAEANALAMRNARR